MNILKKIIFYVFLGTLFWPIISHTTATFSISDEDPNLLNEIVEVDRSIEDYGLVESLEVNSETSNVPENQENLTERIEDDKNSLKLSDEGVEYQFNGEDGNSTAIVTGYNGVATEIEIPAEVMNDSEGWTFPSRVVAVGDSAFAYTLVTDVVLPDTIIDIGSAAFIFTELKSIVIPDSVITIGNNAFGTCRLLTDITFGEGLESIGTFSFSNTNLINGLIMPNSLKEIGGSAFLNANMSSVQLNEGLITIGTNSFSGNNLSKLVIPDSVQNIGTSAFFNNELTELHIGAGLTSIGQTVFAENQLSELVIPENITSIGLSALRNNQFKNIIIPESVKSLAATVFSNCLNLEEITFLGNMNSLGVNIFTGTPLTNIVVSEEYMEEYRNSLSIAVMSGVTEQTRLSVEYPFYSSDTNLQNNINAGDSIQFMAIPNNRYYLSDLDSLKWIETIPVIEWFKDEAKLFNESSTIFTINDAKELDNGVYYAIVDGTKLENITVMVSPLIDPTIPAVEPEGKIPDILESPFEEALSIRFVSQLDFGEAEMKNREQKLFSFPTKNLNGENSPNMVTIQDMRPENQRDGWLLSVRQNKEFLDGAQIIMNPYAHEEFIEKLNLNILNSALLLNDQNQFFAGASTGNPAGIVSLGMDHPNGEGVQLNVPSGVGVGEHTTFIEWSLVSSP